MRELFFTSIIWALSFTIIGVYISPNVDAYFAVLIRIICGLLLFLPMIKKTDHKTIFKLILIGAFQFGITYMLLYQSYRYLTVIEVVLFTITTPIYIVLIGGLIQKTFSIKALICAILAVIGAFIIRYQSISDDYWTGFLLLQAANASFALGQVLYKLTIKQEKREARTEFFWFFVGALLIVLPMFFTFGSTRINLTTETVLALLYVGFLATGLGQFLWCVGAQKVTTGALSVMNNIVIPMGIVVSLLFGATIESPLQFILGTIVIIFSWWLSVVYKR